MTEATSSVTADTQSARVLIRMAWALGALVLLLVVGTLGFLWLGPEGTEAFDAFYMTAITITTVGYGEVVDISQTHPGRLFAAFIAFAGFGLVTFIFTSLTVFFLETDLNKAIRRRRMEKAIKKLHKHYIVCGFGRVGRNVATELQTSRYRFVAIEQDLEALEQFLSRHPGLLYLHGDASDDDLLISADITDAHGIFAVTGDDSRNLMICLTARQLNPRIRIVARCHEMRNADKMRKAGADVVISPDFTGGMRIAASMIRPHVVTFLDEMVRSDQGSRIDEVQVPSGFRTRQLIELGRHHDEYLLLGVRTEERMHLNPGDEFLIEAGQTLIFIGNAEGRVQLEAHLTSEG